jgi:hypothetical protein
VAQSGSHPVEKGEDEAAEYERQTGGPMHARLATASFGSVEVPRVKQRADKNWKWSKLFQHIRPRLTVDEFDFFCVSYYGADIVKTT